METLMITVEPLEEEVKTGVTREVKLRELSLSYEKSIHLELLVISMMFVVLRLSTAL
jgi:hypothetical protein